MFALRYCIGDKSGKGTTDVFVKLNLILWFMSINSTSQHGCVPYHLKYERGSVCFTFIAFYGEKTDETFLKNMFTCKNADY